MNIKKIPVHFFKSLFDRGGEEAKAFFFKIKQNFFFFTGERDKKKRHAQFRNKQRRRGLIIGILSDAQDYLRAEAILISRI